MKNTATFKQVFCHMLWETFDRTKSQTIVCFPFVTIGKWLSTNTFQHVSRKELLPLWGCDAAVQTGAASIQMCTHTLRWSSAAKTKGWFICGSRNKTLPTEQLVVPLRLTQTDVSIYSSTNWAGVVWIKGQRALFVQDALRVSHPAGIIGADLQKSLR